MSAWITSVGHATPHRPQGSSPSAGPSPNGPDVLGYFDLPETSNGPADHQRLHRAPPELRPQPLQPHLLHRPIQYSRPGGLKPRLHLLVKCPKTSRAPTRPHPGKFIGDRAGPGRIGKCRWPKRRSGQPPPRPDGGRGPTFPAEPTSWSRPWPATKSGWHHYRQRPNTSGHHSMILQASRRWSARPGPAPPRVPGSLGHLPRRRRLRPVSLVESGAQDG